MVNKELFDQYFRYEDIKDKSDNPGIIFVGEACEVHIAEIFFTKNIVEIVGEEIKTMGITNILIFDSVGKTKVIKTFQMRLPTLITFTPTNISYKNIKSENDIGDEVIEKVCVLTFLKNSKFIKETKVPKLSTNVIDFFDLLLSGKLPNSIPYPHITSLFLKNQELNGVNMNTPRSVMDLLPLSLYRSPTDKTKLFAHTINKNPTMSMTNYQVLPINALPRNTSVYSTATSEDPMHGMLRIIAKEKRGEFLEESPIEEYVN